jgi:hypothetical protein
MTSEAAGIRRPDAGVLMKAGGNKHIPSAPHLGCRLAAVETASPPPTNRRCTHAQSRPEREATGVFRHRRTDIKGRGVHRDARSVPAPDHRKSWPKFGHGGVTYSI